jgi:DNA-directed RNA polymerase subunit RPC12/RpoP
MSYGEIKKYDIAKEFRQGAASCVKGEGLSPEATEHWKKGWEWAYKNLRPLLSDETNQYIVGLGYEPFQMVEAMRQDNVSLTKEKGLVYCPDCNGHEFTFSFSKGSMVCLKCGRIFDDIAE